MCLLSIVNATAVTIPAVTTPAVTTPEVTTPAVTTPAVTTPEVTTPEVTTPEVTTSEISNANAELLTNALNSVPKANDSTQILNNIINSEIGLPKQPTVQANDCNDYAKQDRLSAQIADQAKANQAKYNKEGSTNNKYLDAFKAIQMPKIVNCGNDNLSEFGGHILYPFGGPDVTYPLLMFPNLDMLSIIGLEPINLLSKYPAQLTSLDKNNLSSLYRRSFFITDQMHQTLVNTLPIIIKQLENLGATKITVQGLNVTNAVQINCLYNGKQRTIRYFQRNLDNSNFDAKFFNSITKVDVVMFKAASYLPHFKNFSKLNEYVLNNVPAIVQDNTGIPYAQIIKHYSVILRGRYVAPYKFNSVKTQLDLKKLSDESNNSALGFCFGYGCGFVPASILIATQIKKNIASK